MSTLRASAGTLSIPAALPFFSAWIAFLISCRDGLAQLIDSSVSAGGISGGVFWAWSIKELTEMLHPSL